MNQTTISPNNKDTLLLVAVPKEANEFYVSIYGVHLFYVFNEKQKVCRLLDTLTKDGVDIIGLASSITEEQAKELVEEFEVWMDIKRFKGFDGGYIDALEALRSFIESSGLTIGKDQDCLILKLN